MSEKRRRFEAQALPHLDAAYNLARRIARPPLDADDIVQDAMLRALRSFETFRGDNMKPWLLSIVRNCMLTAAGQTQRRVSVPLPSDAELDLSELALIASDPDPEEVVMQSEQTRKMNWIIGSMPQDFREVLVLREMEDLSYRQIADIIGVPIGTVMSRLARARVLLKQNWVDQMEDMPHALQ